jgi:predicted secreted hydrolase
MKPFILLLTLSVVAFHYNQSSAADQAVPAFTDEGFRVPQPGRVLEAPAMHGSHPDYRIEWWYLTGHLAAGDRRFGYQATFFRYATRKDDSADPTSPFSTTQLHMTHMALSDINRGDFHYQQRIHRQGWDAHAAVGQLDVRHGNWSLSAANAEHSAFDLRASVGADVRWQLRLQPVKPLVRFGDDGTSRKGTDPQARSYYLSFTRMLTSGSVIINGTPHDVTGSSWMDHEISSSQLDPRYVGWDWIAIQLSDGWEVKAYLLRDADDRPSPYSALIWIAPDGTATQHGPDAFTWDFGQRWTSPHSDAAYPVAPVISTTDPRTGQPLQLHFHPLLKDQELVLPGTTYWEGAGDVTDASGRTLGTAYLELVGYAGPIEGLR